MVVEREALLNHDAPTSPKSSKRLTGSWADAGHVSPATTHGSRQTVMRVAKCRTI